MNVMRLLQAAQKYAGLKSSELTTELVRQFAVETGLPFTEAGLQAVVESVQSGSLDTLADYMSEPKRLTSLMEQLNGEPETPLCRCPHCSKLFELHFEPTSS